MNKKKFIKRINPLYLKGICHRGLHNDSMTENGMKAFKNAIDHHMAFEFDVHLTKDNELVVFHDSDTKRICGKEGIIEDLTLKEIKDNYRLADGEQIPTLKEVLDLNNEQVPMVIELKVYNKNYKPLCARVKKELEVIKDKKNIMMISFDPRALFAFKKSQGFTRSLLLTTTHRWVYFFRTHFESLDMEYVFLKEKKVQRYSKNHFINIWTVEKMDVLNECLPYCDTMTFQHLDTDKVIKALETKNKEFL